jgi:TonB family protein
MTATRTSHRIAFALTTVLLLQTASAANQDALAGAKDLYLSAAYDEALAAFDRLLDESSNNVATEAAQYRVFCLIALQRSDEARKAIEGIVNAEPFYRPSDAQTSPRILNVFQEVRRALLPAVVQRSYADARAAFDRKDPEAAAQFDRVLALLDDPDMRGAPVLSDLRTVVSGFRDLSKAVAPTTPASSGSPAAALDAAAAIQGEAATAARVARADESPAAREEDDTVIPPVALSQPLPRWTPATNFAGQRQFTGTLQVLIDEMGNVASVTLSKSVHPAYDGELLKVARTWKFKPAMKNGVPTKYLKIIDVQLRPAG